MKKLAILLTLAMLISSVSVLAAPQIDYMFYDEEDSTYYAFGSYANPDYSNAELYSVPNDVGVYLGNDFEEVYNLYDENRNISITTNPGKFGIGFKASSDYFGDDGFMVTPYVGYKTTDRVLGDTVSMDVDGEGIQKSSEARLAGFNCVGKMATGVGAVIMEPAFSPDVKNYTLYSNVIADTYYKYDYKTMNSKASAVLVREGDVVTVTVTSEDESATETYTFTHVADKATYNSSIGALYSTAYEYLSGVYKAVDNKTGYEQMYIRNSGGRKFCPIMTFTLTDDNKTALLNAESIVLGLNIAENANSDYAKDLTVSVYEFPETAVTINDTAVTYATTKLSTLLGDAIADYTIYRQGKGSDTAFNKCSIEVTDFVKQAINAGQSSVSFLLEITGIDYTGAAGTGNFTYWVYDYTNTTKGYNPRLLYK